MDDVEKLREQIRSLEEENARLRNCNHCAEDEKKDEKVHINTSINHRSSSAYQGDLKSEHIERYSRQLLLNGGFGVEGQLKLIKSSVLVVGAGGIGSTVILYLAACGIGKISIVDFDEVDVSNLHRQIIHKTNDVGMNKAESARRAVENLNPSILCTVVKEPLTANNALELISSSDCVVDASDNPQTRYLINDACVLSEIPLVSGSAMGIEGQLTVYNYRGGPCYRCLYPKPNAAEGNKSCAENGVLGPVPGLIGILQAVETIKIITGTNDVLSDRLLMYDSLQCSFLRIKKPPRQTQCPVCGPEATITSMEESFGASQLARGPSCCPMKNERQAISNSLSISCTEYDLIRDRGDLHILLDVRVKEQFDLCSLPGAINIPLTSIPKQIEQLSTISNGTKPVYCICRRGIASVIATNMIVEGMQKYTNIHSIINITGGYNSWRSNVDKSFPMY